MKLRVSNKFHFTLCIVFSTTMSTLLSSVMRLNIAKKKYLERLAENQQLKLEHQQLFQEVE